GFNGRQGRERGGWIGGGWACALLGAAPPGLVLAFPGRKPAQRAQDSFSLWARQVEVGETCIGEDEAVGAQPLVEPFEQKGWIATPRDLPKAEAREGPAGRLDSGESAGEGQGFRRQLGGDE